MTFTRLLVLTCTAFFLTYGAVHASNGALAQLQVPARALPVPTDVSPEMQRMIAAPRIPAWNVLWKTGEEWRAAANAQAAGRSRASARCANACSRREARDQGRGEGLCRDARRHSV